MRALILRLTLPLLILLALELAFRAGAWERMTPKNSHTGKAARVTRGLQSWPGNINFVTIGDSRARMGLDHQLIANTAANHGKTHANLAMAGTHFLVENLLIELLESEHPDLQGGIIATSVPALLNTENGDYELAIAQPLSKIFRRGGILLDRFKRNRASTWGAASSLYQYREDIQDFLMRPHARLQSLHRESYSTKSQLFASSPFVSDVCGMDWTDLASCAAYSGNNAHQMRVASSCTRYLSLVKPSPDPGRFVRDPPSPRQQATLDARQAQFRSIEWTKPPVVLLMPVSHLWFQELAPEGSEEWAHRILDPLANEGKIRLLDYSHFFEKETGSRCEAFSDPHHQSELGLQELTADLLPKLEHWLYSAQQ